MVTIWSQLVSAGCILGRPLWWSNIFFVLGLGLIIATAPIMTYMTIGTIWCGWACPQNTVSELANNLTHKLPGKRANMDIDSEGLKVAASKNHEKKGDNGLLQFHFSEDSHTNTWRGYLDRMAARFNWWVGAIFLLGCVMFVWEIIKAH